VAELPETDRELGADQTGTTDHDDFQILILRGGVVIHSGAIVPPIRFSV
jgi:hypothetical protein